MTPQQLKMTIGLIEDEIRYYKSEEARLQHELGLIYIYRYLYIYIL